MYRFFINFCLAPCGFTTEYPQDLIHYTAVRRIYLACINAYRVQLPLAAAAALCVGIPAVVAAATAACCCCSASCAGWQKMFSGPLNLMPAFYFSLFKNDIFLGYPMAVLSHLRPRFCLYYVYPRQIRACAEPRRASARRGEAPFVFITLMFALRRCIVHAPFRHESNPPILQYSSSLPPPIPQ